MKIGRLNKDQKGFSLLELVIAIALTGLITTAITMTVFQVFNMNTRTANRMTAVSQVQHAGKMVSEDILEAQNVTAAEGSGFPLTLTRTEGGTGGAWHQVVYTLEDGELWRSESIDGEPPAMTRVAEYIDATQTSIDPQQACQYPNCGVFTFTVTAALGDETETRVYEVQPRPGT